MCDYSLMGMPNRLACKGEELVAVRFQTGSLGLIAAPVSAPTPTPETGTGFWSKLKSLFRDAERCKVPVVCIPPGSRLLLRDIPRNLQRSLNVGQTEEVTFTQVSPLSYAFRDAFRFKNGAELFLQRLKEGQRVKVLELDVGDESLLGTASGGTRYSFASHR
jgi:hypothetical protein